MTSRPTPLRGARIALSRMLDMRLDHLSYAAGPDGLASTAQLLDLKSLGERGPYTERAQ